MSERINIYTDGSSLGNPGPGGYGIIMEWEGMHHIKEFSEGYRLTTNNRMELLAVIVGLETIKRERERAAGTAGRLGSDCGSGSVSSTVSRWHTARLQV